MSTIGERIRELRFQRGLTQADLSSDLATASMISQIESGKATPSHSLLTAIANRLGAPIEYFLNESDQLHSPTTNLNIGRFHIVRGNPAKALDVLQSIPPEHMRLRETQTHMWLSARAHRQLGQYASAVSLLEDLREQSLRSQDTWLLFRVCVESGHVEYAMDNYEGAMHEWQKALSCGEQVLETLDPPRLDFQYELMNLHMLLGELCEQTNRHDEAKSWFQSARTLAPNVHTFMDVAATLIEQSQHLMQVQEYALARANSEQALAVTTAVQWLMQSRFIDTRTARDSNLTPTLDVSDDLDRIALATIASDIPTFMEGQLAQLDDLVQQGRLTEALDLADTSERLLHDHYALHASTPQMVHTGGILLHRLTMRRTRILSIQGDHDAAIRVLEASVPSLQTSGLTRELIQTWAQLIHLQSERQNHEAVLALVDSLEETARDFLYRPLDV